MPRPRRASVDGDDARCRILDAAELLFARDGFDGTPTAKIADQAKVGKGLLFYYFPKKVDILQALLDERLPKVPSSEVASLSRPDDIAGSLTRLARRLDLAGHHAVALRSIIFREAGTHREAREHAQAFRTALHELTERVLDAASAVKLNARRRREAAQTYVAVMLDEANARRLGAPGPDLAGAARIVATSLAGPS